jgi:hypothetical protein
MCCGVLGNGPPGSGGIERVFGGERPAILLIKSLMAISFSGTE